MPIISFWMLNFCPGITEFSSTVGLIQEVLNENKPEHQYKKAVQGRSINIRAFFITASNSLNTLIAGDAYIHQ